MDIQKLRRFLSNDFKNAILSIREKDGELISRLTIKEKSKINGPYIGIYTENLKKLRKDSLKLCDYMLDSFLSNHTVIGINYFTRNQYHPDKTCFDIITTEGTFTIALGNCDIKDIFPDFVKKVEFAKREGILKHLSHKNIEEIRKLKKQLFLSLNQIDKNIKTGLSHYNYNILSFPKNNGITIPKYEKDFVVRFIQEILIMYGVTNGCFYESELNRIESKRKRILNFNQSLTYSRFGLRIGDVIFDFYEDKRALIQLELIEEAIKGLESEFEYHSLDDISDNFDKQLVLKNYKNIGGH